MEGEGLPHSHLANLYFSADKRPTPSSSRANSTIRRASLLKQKNPLTRIFLNLEGEGLPPDKPVYFSMHIGLAYQV